MKKILASFSIFMLVAVSLQTSAAPSCIDLFADAKPTYIGAKISTSELSHSEIYHELNRVTSEKYPELAFMLKDPRGFLSEMQARFEKRKNLQLDPLYFSYPEAGKQALDFAQTALEKQVKVSGDEIDRLTQILNKTWLNRFVKIKALESRIKEREKALSYARELLKEIDDTRKTNYPYLQVIEVSYYSTRLLGHFDFANLSAFQKLTNWVDKGVNGFMQKSIETEYQYYLTRTSPVYQNHPTGHQFGPSSRPFREAFEDRTKLSYVVIPTNACLEDDIFQRLMPIEVHFFGMSDIPILADGFNRPGGMFWMHDVRHESVKYYKKFLYAKKHHLTEEQQYIVDQMSEKWFVELEQARSSVADPELFAAIRLYNFNYHHDQGNPFIPSEFLVKRGTLVITALFFQELVAGQKFGFTDYRLLSLAEKWLEAFWQSKTIEENQILATFGERP